MDVIDELASPDAESSIRKAGLRVTAQRVAAVRALRVGSHASAEEVFERVAATLPGTSLQATYVVLAALTGAGVLRRIEPAGSAARYELRIGDNHHHVVCSLCGAIEDVDCVVGAAPCLHPSDAAGFLVQAAEVTFWGLCPECRAAEAAPLPSSTRDLLESPIEGETSDR
jgi:Fe2+ or Zn2+ uptake regulation protein